jgi:hypothetical protein
MHIELHDGTFIGFPRLIIAALTEHDLHHNSVALSFAPKGPGTLFFTAGMDLRNTAIAIASSDDSVANSRMHITLSRLDF